MNRYKWVRDGMPATIIINNRHNHDVTSSETLSFRKLDPAIRRMFAGYFDLGMSASAAAKYHQQRIQTDPSIGNPAIALEDAARNPRKTTVSYLYGLWRESKLEWGDAKNEEETAAPVPATMEAEELPPVGKFYLEDEDTMPADFSDE